MRWSSPVDRPAERTDRPVILVADDDPSIRSLLQTALERQGFAAVVASNGREAIDLLGRTRVHIALLDLEMPVLDGLETIRAIRADDRHRTLRIILVTGSDSETARIDGFESGADDYIAKPVNLNELTARVRAHLRGQSAWARELERSREDRRRLASALETLPRGEPLTLLAGRLVERIRPILGMDGMAILHFTDGVVRTIASTGDLAMVFRPGKMVARDRGREIASRAEDGAWLESSTARSEPDAEGINVAYIPYRLGPTPRPLGCLVFGLEPRATGSPLSHRLPDLIDATDYIVAVLRPAVEQAESAGAATTRLQRIISRHEFEIHVQPIARLDTGEQVAVEALTRFSGGMRPDLLFAEATSVGLGAALQRATLAGAIATVAELPESIALSVNLSADVLRLDPGLLRIVAVAGRPLIIEITEHERIDDYDAVRSALARLGPDVKLAVDDAGSGYASLRHILALQPAYVKLDIEWVHDIHRDPVRRALVSGLTYFASETGCELIAEGIETSEELAAIRDLGIGLGQGYLLGRPMPVADLNPLEPHAGPT
jgi:EAL domain-containing protein (putative c-di-GMP-specific phosphodiesterase class I)/CheY-like chemotaxis protein